MYGGIVFMWICWMYVFGVFVGWFMSVIIYFYICIVIYLMYKERLEFGCGEEFYLGC